MENNVKRFASTNAYNESGNLYWKEIDGYLAVMIERDGKVFIEVQSGLEDGPMPMAIGEKVAEMAEAENVNDCIVNKASLLLSFSNDDVTPQQAEILTGELVELLKANSVPGINACPLCNQDMDGGNNVYVKINSRLMKVHKDCYEKFVEDIEVAKEKQKGNPVTGILGAIIFGAIGTIPWIIVGIMGWFASILGMVIGLSANYGYNLFKGRQGKIKSVTLVVVLVAMVIAAGFVTQLYELFKYLGEEGIEDVAILDGLRFIVAVLREDSEFARSFVLNAAMGIGFGMLGSWRIIKASGEEAPINNLKHELVE